MSGTPLTPAHFCPPDTSVGACRIPSARDGIAVFLCKTVPCSGCPPHRRAAARPARSSDRSLWQRARISSHGLRRADLAVRLLRRDAAVCQLRCSHIICSAVFEFLRLAVVPVLHRAVIAGDAAVDLGFFSAEGADRLLSCKIAVVFADGIRRRQGIVRQAVIFRDFPNEACRRLPVRQLFSEEGMEYRAGGIERLQFILYIERGEDILGVSDRQMAGVCIIRRAVFVRRNDIRDRAFLSCFARR